MAYYYKNMIDRAEYMKAYRLINKDKIKLQIKKWSKNNKQKEKDCKKAWAKANPDKIINSNKKQVAKCKEFKNKIKIHYGCLNPMCPCKQQLPHHIDKKSFNIGAGTPSMTMLIAEINKCTLLRAICHRMATWGKMDCSSFQKCLVDEKGVKTQ